MRRYSSRHRANAERIGARAHEIALRVLHLVRVQFQLGLHQVDLLLQSVRLRAFQSGLLFLELVDHLLVGGDLSLGPA